MNEHPPVILYVENDPNDVILLRVAFEKLQVAVELMTVADGEKAQAYLESRDAYADRSLYPLPDLVLMDLKMPRKSGLEVTRWIRAQPALEALPIIILTSSEQPEDQTGVMAAGANGFFIKPVGLEELEHLVHEIATHWLHAVPHGG